MFIHSKTSISLFLVAFTTFIVYLLGVNIGINPPVILFWIPAIGMVIITMYNIIICEAKNQSGTLILFEIFLMTLAFHLISVVPVSTGMLGHDAHFDYYAAKEIADNGWPIPENVPILTRTQQYSEWPMLHLFAVSTAMITGADLFTVAKWLPSIYSSFAIIFMYLLTRTIYNDKRTALLASFGASGILWYIFFHSKFVREGFAFVLFFGVLYVYAKAMKERKMAFGSLAILLAVSLMFAHHLTSFLLLLLLFVWTFFNRFDVLRLARVKSVNALTGQLVSGRFLTFSFLVLISAFSYWSFISGWVIGKFVTMATSLNIARFQEASTRYIGSGSLRVTIVSYGDLLIVLLLSLLVLIEVLRKKKYKTTAEDAIFLLWNSFMLGFVFMLSFVMRPGVEHTRFLVYGYPFLLAAAANTVLKVKYKKILCGLFAIFILLSLFSIPQHIYDRSVSPEYESGEYRNYYLPSEYTAVYWSNLSGVAIGDYRTNTLFGGLLQLKVAYGENAELVFGGDFEVLKKFDWLIFNYDNLKSALMGQMRRAGNPMTNETYQHLQGFVYLSKVYGNGQVEMYYVRR